ncbi:MAG: PQQ-binding-like beta-propeller repeat protein [Planctomycetota bacterium]
MTRSIAAASILISFVLSAAPASAADAAPAWPQENGPFGNFNPRQYGAKLVDDLKDAKQLWVSETNVLGRSKGSASGYVDMLADPATHAGSSTGLIVAEGKVFASSFRPRGDAWPERDPRISKDAGKYTGERLEALKRNTAFDADDLTVAIDLKTGKTVWTAIEEGKGINRAAGKRLQFHGTPVYFDGRVFSHGTAGRVYCYDAATGKKIWEDESGTLVKTAAALKEKLLKDRSSLPGGEGMGGSPVVAGGVLVVQQYGTPGQDVGLRGLDVSNGKTLWETPPASSRYATPGVWTHQEKQYLLAATIKGELRLIDPKDGKVLWTVTGLEPMWASVVSSQTHAFVNVKSEQANPKSKGASWGRIGAYRITPEKAELAWKAPDKPACWFENQMDICAMRRLAVRDGRVYFAAQGNTEDPKKTSQSMSILDENTGEMLATSNETGSPYFLLVEDRMLFTRDASHFKKIKWQFMPLDPKNFKPLGVEWTAPHDNTTAYEVFIELPYVDGLFLMRTWQGQVVCYDLRGGR